MEIQTIIVAIVIFIALFYVGKIALAKVKSFSAKSNCGNDCGCDAKSTKKLAQIQRN
jgi:hypothetical protein